MDRWLILFAHGSRDPRWRAPFDELLGALRAAGVAAELGFLESIEPTFADAVARAAAAGARELRVVPLFWSGGAHLDRDLPPLVDAARAAHPRVTMTVLPAIGEHERFAALLVELLRSLA